MPNRAGWFLAKIGTETVDATCFAIAFENPLPHPMKNTNTFQMNMLTLLRLLGALAAANCWLSGAMAADIARPNAAVTAPEKAPAQPAGYGSHGMAVFGGRDGLYASHLPMFHAPHDAQVLLRFHLVDAAADAKLRAQLARKPELWTLEPELFDLHRLGLGQADPLKQFTARFVQGHFERGGVERYAGQTVVVDDVLWFKRLDGKPVAHSAGHYLVVGAGREYFAVKEIDRRPDFDVIVAMKPLRQPLAASDVRKLTVNGVPQFDLTTEDLKTPSVGKMQAALSHQGAAVLRPAKTLYFETDDLN